MDRSYRRQGRLHRAGQCLENGYIESFNARLRDELLDGEIFYSLREARIVIEAGGATTHQAARLTWIQATSTGGVRACLRRVAGCATTSGSAGHAGATANLKLTFHLDHSTGADHCTPGAKAELPRAAGAARAFH
jgi:transposase InsO family protein